MKLVTSGALDRHPELKVLISEGGATWVPFIGDRMNEGYRQHGAFVRPTLVAPAEGDPVTARCTRRSSTTRPRRPRCGPWATTTCCGGATTRTSRVRTATRRRRCTSCSTTSSPRCVGRDHAGRVQGALPARERSARRVSGPRRRSTDASRLLPARVGASAAPTRSRSPTWARRCSSTTSALTLAGRGWDPAPAESSRRGDPCTRRSGGRRRSGRRVDRRWDVQSSRRRSSDFGRSTCS